MNFSGQAFDAPAGDEPARHLLICTTPRTGGHTLSAALYAAGLGVPMEYFNPDFMLPLQQRWLGLAVRNTAEARSHLGPYATALEQWRSPKGLFAVKLFPDHYRLYAAAFQEHERQRFHLRLTRADKVAQAISFAALLITRKPFDTGETVRHLPRIGTPDQDKMLQILAWIQRSEAAWDDTFRTLDPATCLSLTMEEDVANPQAALARITAKFSLTGQTPAQPAPVRQKAYAEDQALKAELMEKFGPALRAAMSGKGPAV